MCWCRKRVTHASTVAISAATSFVGVTVLAFCGTVWGGEDPKSATDAPSQSANAAESKLGLLQNDPQAAPGYTLFSSMWSKITYLIDNQGRIVKQWESDATPGHSVYLLENGHLLRPGVVVDQEFGFTPGAGGKVQEFTWDGELIWEYTLATAKQLQHHDICRLPNGNVVLIVWEKKSIEEVIAAGRRPALTGEQPL